MSNARAINCDLIGLFTKCFADFNELHLAGEPKGKALSPSPGESIFPEPNIVTGRHTTRCPLNFSFFTWVSSCSSYIMHSKPVGVPMALPAFHSPPLLHVFLFSSGHLAKCCYTLIRPTKVNDLFQGTPFPKPSDHVSGLLRSPLDGTTHIWNRQSCKCAFLQWSCGIWAWLKLPCWATWCSNRPKQNINMQNIEKWCGLLWPPHSFLSLQSYQKQKL